MSNSSRSNNDKQVPKESLAALRFQADVLAEMFTKEELNLLADMLQYRALHKGANDDRV